MVDDTGLLIDDIRIREFLVVPVTARVSDLMDRRYVTLKATDTQRDAVEVFRREDRSALPVTDTSGNLIGRFALGCILGAIGFLRISIWSAFSNLYGPHWLLVALTVAVALVGVVLWGSLVGSVLPFILRRLGFDPAASSAPFVATLVDVTGLVIYFSVGFLVLRGTLL